MADDTVRVQESVATEAPGFLCEYCGGPKEVEGKRRIRSRRFCSDLCRSRWHERRKSELQTKAEALLAELGSVVSELFKGRRS